MRVFKFGGSSIKDAASIRNVAEIIKANSEASESLVVVVSAMGKTTNALEKVVRAYVDGEDALTLWNEVLASHQSVVDELFDYAQEDFFKHWRKSMTAKLSQASERNYDFEYDQIVSMGELMSTSMVAAYLINQGTAVKWMDARELILTNNNYREGRIDWERTQKAVEHHLHFTDANIYLTQGFLGGSEEGFTTTLAREGSDFTAAIIANCLDAESATIWKDVPGVLNADPRIIDSTKLIERLSYYEAIEMTYYGAQVIHPKTLKPLQNKKIPLYVRSFVESAKEGTAIAGDEASLAPELPVIVYKRDQILIALFTKDHSFIAENNLSDIYGELSKYNIKVNLSQNGATSFSFCIDQDLVERYPEMLENLGKDFRVETNKPLTLLTIRNHNEALINERIGKSEILLEQRIRNTIQFLLNP